MEKHNADIVRNIFKRACNIHLPRKATIHLEWAAFEERQGKLIHLSIFWVLGLVYSCNFSGHLFTRKWTEKFRLAK